MTSSSRDDAKSPEPLPPPAEAELLATGWERCFVADEPRLSESADLYRELGFEVTLLPFAPDPDTCTECITDDPGRLWVIYIRKDPSAGRWCTALRAKIADPGHNRSSREEAD